MNSDNKSQLVDVMNDVWCSHKFAPNLALKKYQLSLMETATFLRLKMEQQLSKLRLHHCSQINKKLILSLCTRARL